jgi:hypothetical protein
VPTVPGRVEMKRYADEDAQSREFWADWQTEQQEDER